MKTGLFRRPWVDNSTLIFHGAAAQRRYFLPQRLCTVANAGGLRHADEQAVAENRAPAVCCGSGVAEPSNTILPLHV